MSAKNLQSTLLLAVKHPMEDSYGTQQAGIIDLWRAVMMSNHCNNSKLNGNTKQRCLNPQRGL